MKVLLRWKLIELLWLAVVHGLGEGGGLEDRHQHAEDQQHRDHLQQVDEAAPVDDVVYLHVPADVRSGNLLDVRLGMWSTPDLWPRYNVNRRQ